MNCVVVNPLLVVTFISAVSFIPNSDAAKGVPIKWAQDKDSIFITVSVDCASNKVFAPKVINDAPPIPLVRWCATT
jgi:hypothetical protein